MCTVRVRYTVSTTLPIPLQLNYSEERNNLHLALSSHLHQRPLITESFEKLSIRWSRRSQVKGVVSSSRQGDVRLVPFRRDGDLFLERKSVGIVSESAWWDGDSRDKREEGGDVERLT
ncbi:hypothetical protein RRG08_001059 [Elysia crispata]|uniref:Uncharacterized protein n=1 Tax=Elysia crispata TaxID=231223 RepID=A0AAE1E5F4_9GAST|nr:hypothetical protein RRG08_001059 [Elysia crispata]